ncbi:MAG: phosphoribosylamine--glycine ligase [Desulfohalobiaceae bacterium]
MRVLVVGSGGREHALAWKLKQSPLVREIIVAPGNGGTAAVGENVPVKHDDLPGMVSLARKRKCDLVVVGPELPLVLGLSNALDKEGIPCFGPTAYPAQLEGSKAFAKSLMREAEVPTADFRVFEDYDQARAYLQEHSLPVVVKADGLAAGKGVVICQTREEALEALDDMMRKRVFGTAGERVVIEEALHGEEASFLAFCDGEDIVAMPSSQDHKPIGEGDTGLNTGGMGAYSPAPILPPERYGEINDLVITPLVRHLASVDNPFKGILYAGLMFTAQGPRVLEYNVRFGDPECQPLLMRLESDLAEILLACVQGRLKDVTVSWSEKTSICVVMAAGGYPRKYDRGMPIQGIEDADRMEDVKVFHAGTTLQDGQVLAAGGRVLGVTALGDDLTRAKQTAYAAVERIHFDGQYYRRDIGDKGIRRLQS